MLQTLIFDFDGIIINSEFIVFELWKEFAADHGLELPLSEWIKCVGSTNDAFDPYEWLASHSINLPPKKEFNFTMEQKARQLIYDEPLLPGVENLIQDAARNNIALAIASSSDTEWVHTYAEHHDIKKYFQTIVAGDQVARRKPFPDLFRTALERLNAQPETAVIIEDSYNGLRAAMAAGVRCITVPNRITRLSDFTGAAAVLPTLEGQSISSLNTILLKS